MAQRFTAGMSKENSDEANKDAEPSRQQTLLELAEIIGGAALSGLGLAVAIDAMSGAAHNLAAVAGGLIGYASGISIVLDGSRRSNRNVRLGAETDRQRQQLHEQALGDCDLEVAEFPIIDLTGNDFPDVR